MLYGPLRFDLDLEIADIQAAHAYAVILSQKLGQRPAEPEQGIVGPHIPVAVDDQIDLVSGQLPRALSWRHGPPGRPSAVWAARPVRKKSAMASSARAASALSRKLRLQVKFHLSSAQIMSLPLS